MSTFQVIKIRCGYKLVRLFTIKLYFIQVKITNCIFSFN